MRKASTLWCVLALSGLVQGSERILEVPSVYPSIRAAVSASANGDTVLVGSGRYTEAVDLLGKAITLQGMPDASGAPVLINPHGPAVLFGRNEGPATSVRNFIIKDSPIAILVAGASPSLVNLTVVDNGSGIIATPNSSPDIRNCIFWNNQIDVTGAETPYCWVQSQVDAMPLGPTGRWSFEETSGNVVKDLVGGRDGELLKGASRTEGKVGKAVRLDGIDDCVALPKNDPIWLPQGDFAVAMWVQFDRPFGQVSETLFSLNFASSSDITNRVGCIVGRGLGTVGLIFALMTQEGLDETLVTQFFTEPQRWYHVVATRIGKSQALYVDGQQVGSRVCSASPLGFRGGSYDDDTVRIGCSSTRPSGSVFHIMGKVDEFMLFEHGLTETQVADVYETGELGPRHPSEPGFAHAGTGDFHLKSARGRYWPRLHLWVLDKATSPCIDAGDPNSDSSQEPQPNGGRVNLGAYGGTAYASLSTNLAPAIHVVLPKPATTVGTQFTARVEALDPDGSIAKVEIFLDGVKVGETTDGREGWICSCTAAHTGQQQLVAKAVDDQGAFTFSDPVSIGVTSASGGTGTR